MPVQFSSVMSLCTLLNVMQLSLSISTS